MRRNPQIALRIPEATTIGRVKGFNRPKVERFYKPLSEHITRIYNIDETGTWTSINKPPIVLLVKGKKQVVYISSTERGQTTTVVSCCNASGLFVPMPHTPLGIRKRKIQQSKMLKSKLVKWEQKWMKNMNKDLNAKPKTATKKNTKMTINIIV